MYMCNVYVYLTLWRSKHYEINKKYIYFFEKEREREKEIERVLERDKEGTASTRSSQGIGSSRRERDRGSITVDVALCNTHGDWSDCT